LRGEGIQHESDTAGTALLRCGFVLALEGYIDGRTDIEITLLFHLFQRTPVGSAPEEKPLQRLALTLTGGVFGAGQTISPTGDEWG
jgi:hypothetical protein